MSDYEHHKGTLTPIRPDLSAEEFAEKVYTLKPGYETKLEMLKEDDTYIVINDTVHLIKDKCMQSDEWYDAGIINDKIWYDVMFYNGGCGFKEAIEDSIKNIKN